MPTIKVSLNTKSIDKAIKELEDYKKSIPKKLDILCQRLAAIGATNVSLGYSRAVYTGKKDVNVSVEKTQNGYAIVAEGETVLFLEFGAGVTYGYGHPKPEVDGVHMGPGTYPDGKGHWDDPKGWWTPSAAGGEHTYGNPPSAAMYQTAKDLRDIILDIAKEVFASD